jgi:hypothetical protein
VGIKLRGRITFFDEDSAPADINGPSDLEQVHKLPANVKISGTSTSVHPATESTLVAHGDQNRTAARNRER